MADTAHGNLVEIIRQAENEYHHDLTDRTMEDYIAEAILNSGYVSAKSNGLLPEIEFSSKTLLYNGINISKGVKDVRIRHDECRYPEVTVTFDCSKVEINQTNERNIEITLSSCVFSDEPNPSRTGGLLYAP